MTNCTWAGDSPALHVIQQIRDEAHRFAITAHRQRRAKVRQQSALEGIPGVGPKKRRELLRHFGGLQGVRQAGVSDLKKVPGISHSLAEKIHDRFHDGFLKQTLKNDRGAFSLRQPLICRPTPRPRYNSYLQLTQTNGLYY